MFLFYCIGDNAPNLTIRRLSKLKINSASELCQYFIVLYVNKAQQEIHSTLFSLIFVETLLNKRIQTL